MALTAGAGSPRCGARALQAPASTRNATRGSVAGSASPSWPADSTRASIAFHRRGTKARKHGASAATISRYETGLFGASVASSLAGKPPLPRPSHRGARVTTAVASDVTSEVVSSLDDVDAGGLGIVEFLKGKNILITGATGFLAKVMVEKILRIQPEVGHLYLLIQPRGDTSPSARLAGVIESPIFGQIREAQGASYVDFMESKLTAVEGNLSSPGLGIDSALAEELQGKVDVVVNSAATTSFDERYDVAVKINTLGARGCLDFAKKCRDIKLYLHVSTAFVNGLRVGRTAERPFALGDTIASELGGGGSDTGPPLDVEAEIQLALESEGRFRAEAEAAGRDPGDVNSEVNRRLVALGMERARLFGWQDTYVFTKAMGEMLVGSERGAVPVAICRPSIVESAMEEPLCGWMEGIRMADPIILAFGKGQIRGFVGDIDGVLDVIPVDYVINAMLAMMARHGGGGTMGDGDGRGAGAGAGGGGGGGGGRGGGMRVYHVATSAQNPLRNELFTGYVGEHFAKMPMKDRAGGDIVVGGMEVFRSRKLFAVDSWLRYQLPQKVSSAKARLGGDSDRREARKNGIILQKTYEQLSYFAQIYAPYTFYECRFDASNTMELFSRLSSEEKARFNFDLDTIDWEHYLVDVHIAGLRKYVLKGRS